MGGRLALICRKMENLYLRPIPVLVALSFLMLTKLSIRSKIQVTTPSTIGVVGLIIQIRWASSPITLMIRRFLSTPSLIQPEVYLRLPEKTLVSTQLTISIRGLRSLQTCVAWPRYLIQLLEISAMAYWMVLSEGLSALGGIRLGSLQYQPLT